jgi:hypothetical protein
MVCGVSPSLDGARRNRGSLLHRDRRRRAQPRMRLHAHLDDTGQSELKKTRGPTTGRFPCGLEVNWSQEPIGTIRTSTTRSPSHFGRRRAGIAEASPSTTAAGMSQPPHCSPSRRHATHGRSPSPGRCGRKGFWPIAIAHDERWKAFLPWPRVLRALRLAGPGRVVDPRPVKTRARFALARELGDPCWGGTAARALGSVGPRRAGDRGPPRRSSGRAPRGRPARRRGAVTTLVISMPTVVVFRRRRGWTPTSRRPSAGPRGQPRGIPGMCPIMGAARCRRLRV